MKHAVQPPCLHTYMTVSVQVKAATHTYICSNYIILSYILEVKNGAEEVRKGGRQRRKEEGGV